MMLSTLLAAARQFDAKVAPACSTLFLAGAQPLSLTLLTLSPVSCSIATSTKGSLDSRRSLDQSLFGWQLHRSFASKSSPSSASSDGSKKKKWRRSETKLYSCRNEEMRMFEQIWPTLQLTEEEAQLFRRTSRVFIQELGRPISMRTRFALAKEDPQQRVHHQEARSLIHGSDLHLDAVGEHPRYLRLRRLRAGNYAIKLQSVRKLRLLMGFTRRYTLQKLYELSLLQPGTDRVWKLICAMEGTLPLVTLRMGMAHDSIAARSMTERGMFYVNGVRPPEPKAMFVQPADIITTAEGSVDWHRQYLASQLGSRMLHAVRRDWLTSSGNDSKGSTNAETSSNLLAE